ncbi:DNA repair protein XRCC4-like [Diabrotica virgifera virgifera]|uniref:DNA repair protein XRCC4-like n=1 Tax=Diabrotica virgifera virgifera TaxID=50390 RepID=A0A6P7G8X0_DIAVI|nr:DNA repair protein XRCC4-like [Diabrotica virgifera virgifera]XP_050513727.1 DNA repair protein XRCC4-like [Diabrotica virgifera virgifera]
MSSLFKKVETQNAQQFRLNIVFNESDFSLVILEKSNAWKAEVSCNDVKKFAKQLDLDAEEYYSTLKLYLQDTPNNVNLKLQQLQQNKFFVCYCNENGINIKYFSCKLEKIPFEECIYDLLDSYGLNNNKKQNTDNSTETAELKKGHAKLEEKLTELVDRNLNREQELYSNFVLVLNEKKRKIQHLTQTIEALKAGRPVLNPEIKARKPKTLKKEKDKKPKQEVNVSESESSNNSDGYNTDDEKSKKAENVTEKVLPSTSKKVNYGSIFDESEDLGNLPKRQRGMSEFKEICNTAEISKVQKIDKETTSASIAKIEEDSPTEEDSFNTQELLDCI